MILALVLLPLVGGGACFALRSHRIRRLLVVAVAAVHAILAASAWAARPAPALGGWLALDALGLLFLSITSALFLAAAVYGYGYLNREESQGKRPDFEEGFVFANAPEAVFSACLLLFLGTMTLVTVCQHFGLLWVAVEATTLASAPLIPFHRHHRSLEATWKYLVICSVGIALALLGNFFLAVAAERPEGGGIPLLLEDLTQAGTRLSLPWLRAAFLFFLVGYGTKMGLAPLHTWLPDAHSEAPSVASALFSGALLNCAALGVLRAYQLCVAAGIADFAGHLLAGFGLLSMAVAAVFVLGQRDYKRMLAYSSVEHMGILALGIGVGGAGPYGAVLHAVNHSLGKAGLFMIAGNILAAYKSKSTSEVRGLFRVLPISGGLFFVGFLALTGAPPFGPFLSEFVILKAMLDAGRGVTAVAYLAFLGVVFVGMASAVLAMTQGPPPSGVARGKFRESIFAVGPPAVLALFLLLLGVWIPGPLRGLLEEAARSLGGG